MSDSASLLNCMIKRSFLTTVFRKNQLLEKIDSIHTFFILYLKILKIDRIYFSLKYQNKIWMSYMRILFSNAFGQEQKNYFSYHLNFVTN